MRRGPWGTPPPAYPGSPALTSPSWGCPGGRGRRQQGGAAESGQVENAGAKPPEALSAQVTSPLRSWFWGCHSTGLGQPAGRGQEGARPTPWGNSLYFSF